MTWQAPRRSPVAEQIYAEAERDRADNPHRYRFDPDAVAERASRRDEFPATLFADGWADGLR